MTRFDPTWPLLQLIDSAFPSGAFAHSSGLEAAWQLGDLSSSPELVEFLRSSLRQASTSTAVFAAMICAEPDRASELDSFLDTMLTNAVANKASRTQGQSLAMAATRIFPSPKLESLAIWSRNTSVACHFPIAFGAIQNAMGADATQTINSFLFVTLRGLISAAIRLGVVGPLEGQAIQYQLSQESPTWIAACAGIQDIHDVHFNSPVLDFYQSLQNRLYSRLFVS